MKQHVAVWKIHTPNLLGEILNNPSAGILSRPLQILLRTLGRVAERAAALNDPELNELMCRLTLYTVADPEHADYDPNLIRQVEQRAEEARKARQAEAEPKP